MDVTLRGAGALGFSCATGYSFRASSCTPANACVCDCARAGWDYGGTSGSGGMGYEAHKPLEAGNPPFFSLLRGGFGHQYRNL